MAGGIRISKWYTTGGRYEFEFLRPIPLSALLHTFSSFAMQAIRARWEIANHKSIDILEAFEDEVGKFLESHCFSGKYEELDYEHFEEEDPECLMIATMSEEFRKVFGTASGEEWLFDVQCEDSSFSFNTDYTLCAKKVGPMTETLDFGTVQIV